MADHRGDRYGSVLELSSFIVIALYATVALMVAISASNAPLLALATGLALSAVVVWRDLPSSQFATFAGLVGCALLTSSHVGLALILPVCLIVARAYELTAHRIQRRSTRHDGN